MHEVQEPYIVFFFVFFQALDSILNQRCRDFPVDVIAAQLQTRTLPNSQNRSVCCYLH